MCRGFWRTSVRKSRRCCLRRQPFESGQAILITVLQFLTLLFWAKAALADPGYCSQLNRNGACTPGPDGQERLLEAVQREFHKLVWKRYSLNMEGTVANDKVITDTDAAIWATHKRLLNGLKESVAARFKCYPDKYPLFDAEALTVAAPCQLTKLLCPICGRLRSNAKHCAECGRCVLEFDHHCFYIGNCVGARNRNSFVLFLIFSFLSVLVWEPFNWQFITLPACSSEAWSLSWCSTAKVDAIINALWLIFAASLLIVQLCEFCERRRGRFVPSCVS